MRTSHASAAHRVWSVVLGPLLVGVTTVALLPVRAEVSRASPALLLVVPIVASGVVGGRGAALLTAAVASMVFNVAFIPPYWALSVHAPDDIVALAVFGLVALVVGTLVARERERRSHAEARAVELQALNIQLQRVQEERARLAEEATKAAILERVDEQRTALLRSVSHDLRTPLAAVHAVVTDLLGDAPYDDATRTDLLRLVADETDRLDRLVANLLSLSRIEAGALHPDRKPIAVDDLINDTARRLRRLFDARRLEADIPIGLPLARGDYVQLQQVLTNLLENAARHAPAGSIVRIGARETSEDIEIWVDDEGPGIAPHERQRLLEPFRRGDGSTSSGIGLAICQAVVVAHEGRIRIADAPSGGTRVAFAIPKA